MTETLPTLSVIAPCLNEGGHLRSSVGVMLSELEFLRGDFELILIDDGSQDDTWPVIVELAEQRPQVRGIRLSRCFGKELALCSGLEAARGRAVVLLDADLQHPPRLIPEMVRYWREEGFDVVEAVKTDRGAEPGLYRAGIGLFYGLFRRMAGIDLRRASDFKLLDRKVIDAWNSMPERGVFFRGMSAWLGFRRRQIEFDVEPRAGGRSRWSALGLLRLGVTGLTAFSAVPIHVIGLMGLLFLLASMVLGSISMYRWLTGTAVEGFTTVNLLLLVIGSMILIALGVIGEYISRIYQEVKRRPRYVIAELTPTPGRKSEPNG